MTSRAATEYRYEKLTWPEINDAVELGKVCIVPCGAVEQHGPHLPLDVDLVCPGGIARGAGQQIPDKMLVLPIVAYGYTGHVMDFPGTINNDFEHFMHHVLDITKSLAYHGFKKIILLNGHGSNMPNLDLVARRTNLETDAECVLAAWWNLLTVDKEFLPRWRQSKFPGGCAHACELETSLYLYLDGDNVRKDQIKSGTISFNEENSPFNWVDLFAAGPATVDLVDQQLFRDRRAGRAGAGHRRERPAGVRGSGQAARRASSPGSRIGPRTCAATATAGRRPCRSRGASGPSSDTTSLDESRWLSMAQDHVHCARVASARVLSRCVAPKRRTAPVAAKTPSFSSAKFARC